MTDQVQLNDIADELLILNKMTVDKLFKSEQPADCIALYVFYYKTAKWQKTNRIKANDNYVKKSLKWGVKRVSGTKKTLKDLGLISIVQSRKDGKVDGWYIEVSYMVTEDSISKIKVETNNTQNDIVDSNNTQKQQVAEATSGFQDTDALKEIDKVLEDKSLDEKNKKEVHRKIDLSAVPENIDSDLIIELIDYKIKKVKTFEQPSFDRTIKKITKVSNAIGQTPNWVIEQTIDSGWQGIGEPSWYQNKIPKNHKPPISETEFKTSGVNFQW